MKIHKPYLWAGIALAGLGTYTASIAVSSIEAAEKTSAADLEKGKALQNPYPHDLGPATLDKATLDGYPSAIQAGYKTLLGTAKKKNCQSCHTSARPLNSSFLQPEAKNDAALREKAKEALEKSQPELFKDDTIWKVDTTIWSRYVKRMMGKPGCNIDSKDGKKIFEFLVYDSIQRKTGTNARKWEAHRKKLLAEFKEKHPHRYEELAKNKEL